jgi:hypothetical protein
MEVYYVRIVGLKIKPKIWFSENNFCPAPEKRFGEDSIAYDFTR